MWGAPIFPKSSSSTSKPQMSRRYGGTYSEFLFLCTHSLRSAEVDYSSGEVETPGDLLEGAFAVRRDAGFVGLPKGHKGIPFVTTLMGRAEGIVRFRYGCGSIA